jgi:hypothetical protein
MSNSFTDMSVRGLLKTLDFELGNKKLREDLLARETGIYPIDLASAVVWDSGQPLPAAAAADDLGYVNGTWATGNNSIQGRDSKAASLTGYARLFVPLPAEYEAGQSVKLRFSAGMKTTVSDDTATLDCEAIQQGRNMLVTGADLVTTSPQDINNLTFADFDFTVTATNLEPGDVLDVRVKLAVVDAATVTAVIAAIGAIDLVCSIRG